MKDDPITLTLEEYEDLIDARDHAVANGAPTLTDAELDDFLAVKAPLTF